MSCKKSDSTPGSSDEMHAIGSNLSPNTTYHWRVDVTDGNLVVPSEQVWNFKTQ